MKTKITLLIVFGLFFYDAIFAQTVLYNFESGTTQAGTADMAWPWAAPNAPYLRAYGVVDNPSMVSPNSTLKAFHILEEASPNYWDNLLRFNLNSPITITSANRYLHILHRRPRLDGGGFVVNINTDDFRSDADKGKTRFDLNLTEINTWQDIVVDLNDLITNSVQLSKFNINPDVNNYSQSGLPLGDYYFDEIILSNNPLPRPYLTGNNLYDFETATSTNISGSIDNGADANNILTYPFTNPMNNARNASANVGKRYANLTDANWWGGFFFTFSKPVQVDAAHKYLHVLVSVPSAGQVILGEVMQASTNVNPDIIRTITYANTWQDVVYDLSSIAYFTGVRINLGYWGGTAAGNYYCDDIYIDDNPNPRTNTFSISGSNTSSSSFGNCTDCDITVSNNVQLTIDQTQTIKSITVAPGAKLTLNTGNTLTATNGITLQSDATGTATILNSGTYSGNITAQQYLGSARNWYVSSPVTNATSPANNITRYYEYVEAGNNADLSVTGSTAYWKGLSTGNSMAIGKGYIAQASAGTTVSFSGTPNNGDITTTFDLTRDDAKGKGFNLVGNPYPSFIDWSLVAAANPNLSKTFYFRSKNTNLTSTYTFASYNGLLDEVVSSNGTPNTTITRFIPPTQAFWVRVNSGTSATKMYFNNDMRAHRDDNGNLLKVRKVDNRTRLRLQLINGSETDETLICTDDNATNNFDIYDSPKMMNNSSITPDLYTKSNDERLVINGLNAISNNLELPLGFSLNAAATLKLKATEISNFPVGTRIYLLDKEENSQTELMPETQYTFSTTAATTNNESRFSLLFRAPGVTTGIENSDKLNAHVFVNAANQITIIAPENSNFSIYNAVGQLIENGTVNKKHETRNTKLETGIFVVKVNNQSTRVIVK